MDPNLPADRYVSNAETLLQLKTRERAAVRLIEAFETSSQKLVSGRDSVYREALRLLDIIIVEYPDYASARNNRAQLARWRFGDRNMICQRRSAIDPERTKAVSAVVTDLEKAIALSSPVKPQDAVSPGQGRLLGQAYTQLAALYYAASKDLSSDDDMLVVCNNQQTRDSQFEEEASRLFYLGGLYGNEVAKALAVYSNPHAKLCGTIVQQAMRKEMAQV